MRYAKGRGKAAGQADPNVWIWFGTFPFFPCSPDPEHQRTWLRVKQTANTTIRNDPDRRLRLNIDAMTGNIRVTDFGNPAPLGNIFDGEKKQARSDAACL